MGEASSSMLPSLHKLTFSTDVKREREDERESGPPCHEELRYADGETINNKEGRDRVQGGSASFAKNPIPGMPLGRQLMTRDDILQIDSFTDISVDHVLAELYSEPRVASNPASKPYLEYDAFMEAEDNSIKPQYYLHDIQKRTTLVHVQNDGIFWRNMDRGETNMMPEIEERGFTNGFVWTNPSRAWAWKSDSEDRFIRIKINVDPGTQVLIDRAPVYKRKCRMDDERDSIYPDVLLGPAQFRVTKVKRYRRVDGDYTTGRAFKLDKPSDVFEYAVPRRFKKAFDPLDDEDRIYAEHRLWDSKEFVDIELELESQVKFPAVGTIKWTFE